MFFFSSTNTTEYAHANKMNLDPYLTLFTKINLTWTIGFSKDKNYKTSKRKQKKIFVALG